MDLQKVYIPLKHSLQSGIIMRQVSNTPPNFLGGITKYEKL
jgi:hypothetical protein